MPSRAASILAYLGFAPEIWLFETEKTLPQERDHVETGLFLNIVFAASVLFITAVSIGEYFVLGIWREIDAATVLLLDIASDIPLLIWGGIFCAGIFCAFRGKSFQLSFINRAFRGRLFLWFALVWGFASQILFILLVIITTRAAYFARSHSETPSVFMLYENAYPTIFGVTQVPEQIFALGFYPIAETAASRWGDASIAVEPLSDENLAWALQNGRMVFLASHGGSTVGSISMSPDPYDNFYPEEIPEIGGTGPDLQFVYIAGCDAGRRNDAWQRYLGPAKLVTFDRFSWVIEHVYWLWFQGPAVVNELR